MHVCLRCVNAVPLEVCISARLSWGPARGPSFYEICKTLQNLLGMREVGIGNDPVV